jgi:peptide chain release factor 2
VNTLDRVSNGLKDAGELLGLAVEENDESIFQSVGAIRGARSAGQAARIGAHVPGQSGPHSAFLDIQAGAGALRRTRADVTVHVSAGVAAGLKTEVADISDGEVVGIKGRASTHRRLRLRLAAHQHASPRA